MSECEFLVSEFSSLVSSIVSELSSFCVRELLCLRVLRS